MTGLWILSDLHMDHGAFDLEPPDGADIAVIAGDVVSDDFLIRLSEKLPVVFVAGNHEFYGHDLQERKAQLASLPVHFLDDGVAVFKEHGIRFIGSTLWTDYGRSPVAADAARRGMNDHRKISWSKDPWQRFLPSHATALHEKSKQFIYDELADEYSMTQVVVTHHAPSERSVHKKYAGQIINRAYYSDMDDLVELASANSQALWIHGHVHSSFDYHIGKTRVICNPHGYLGENPGWRPDLVVHVR